MKIKCSECDHEEIQNIFIEECPKCGEKEFFSYYTEDTDEYIEYPDDVITLYDYYKKNALSYDVTHNLCDKIWNSWSDRVDASWLCLLPNEFDDAYTYYYKKEYNYLVNQKKREEDRISKKIDDITITPNLLENWNKCLEECNTENDYKRMNRIISKMMTSEEYWETL
jgi:hypothetical protein